MSVIHFLNVLEGDCNIIQHDSGRVTVIDVSNAYNDIDTAAEIATRNSEMRKVMTLRTQVPSNKADYGQKKIPDNPILYLKQLGIKDIFRFIITHPDMDHLDGIADLYTEFEVTNTWDSDNTKAIDLKVGSFRGGYNPEDWAFYTRLRAGKYSNTNRLTYFAGNQNSFYNEDYLRILCPTPQLLKKANECGDYNDASYILLYTPPKSGGRSWKFLFAGDSDDDSWEYILNNYEETVSNVDVLFAPHHGRDSGRSYKFLNTLKPKYTIFGNASSDHLAYDCYPPTRITNNQAGYVIMAVQEDNFTIYVKNYEFAKHFAHKRGWGEPPYNAHHHAFGIIQQDA